ncbi:MAG TPA: valine--tRNA ligase [Dehalococcoidia bacterium]|nr:valine--tRNA ligase [Dehalococcoidia bacterium]
MTQAPDIAEMPKAYEPGKVERKRYDFWLKQGYFTPEIDRKKKPFVIIHPPTNITGDMHLGTAITATIEDIMIRWHRMLGEPTLWLPGIDHASIATQVVVEKELIKEGTSRQELGREKFLERVWDWANIYKKNIVEQHKRLGASLDWSRLRFTMDDAPSRAVRTVFTNLYKKGLIYRGERIINWCPRCATALSDLEVEHKDTNGHLWYVNYPLVDDKNKFITVATTRPETIVGDTAVAVNPNDIGFKKMVGKKVLLPAVNREIPIVADEAVDMEFGTGAVKITPGHDPVDFDVAQRQGLPLINILNADATMNENAGPYNGMDRFKAREEIIADLTKSGQLVKTEEYSHSVGHCDRCQTMVEPLASLQWFMKMKPLAKPAIKAVRNGRITIIPERFTKVYFNWMENIRDWCISRQLWWGHRIPVWYCRDCNEITVAVETPTSCSRCKSANIEQDPDMLDTWFSSALWPFTTLGWPEDTEDLHYFYPTTVMETGYDILFFWVARMIMMGLENTGKIPFSTVYLHGLIRDEKGVKMTKTKGNVINPEIVIDEYGTDALRFSLLMGTTPGNDSKLSDAKLEAGRNFANKMWNATRFVIRSLEPVTKADNKIDKKKLIAEDRWILSRLNRTLASVTGLMEDFQFGEAERQIHDFLWGEYCDWYIELAKIRLQKNDTSPLPVLLHVLEKSLRLLHPFMPFITEELWQNLKTHIQGIDAESIMVAEYPKADKTMINTAVEKEIDNIIDIVHNIRNVRAQYKVEAGRWVEASIYTGESLSKSLISYTKAIQTLSRANPVSFMKGEPETGAGDKKLVMPLQKTTLVIPLSSMLDVEAEKNRLQKELDGVQNQVSRLEARLQDETFLTKAPEAVIAKEKQKLYTLNNRLEKLKQQSSKL